jgi:hypothetical protein
MSQSVHICERCWQKLDLSILEYGGIRIRVCLTCHKLMAGVLLTYARDLRAVQLQHFKEQWLAEWKKKREGKPA